jgi:cytochrome c oxidase subunit I+III
MSVLLFADGAAFTSILFAYLFLWTVNPDWPVGSLADASLTGPAIAALIVGLSAAAMVAAEGLLARRRKGAAALAIGVATAAMAAWPFVEIAALRAAGLDPTVSSFAAASAVTVGWCVGHAAIACIMGGFLLARIAAGRLDAFYRLSLEVVSLFWWYTAAQALLGLAVVHLFVRAL